MQINSPVFQRYLSYLLFWEGGKSARKGDTAVRCAPFPGAVHTNKGVTFCTFKELAAGLGVVPVTYDRFLKLTDQEVGKFLYEYYRSVGGPNFSEPLSIAITEAAWWSGPERAVIHLQKALNALGQRVTVDGDIGTETLGAAKNVDSGKLYAAYLGEWKGFIDRLSRTEEHKENRTGWFRRLADFEKKFPPAGGGKKSSLLLFTLPLLLMWGKSK